jgi:glucosamine--fructose-6-phosphate aminotransferase (isomerizing)
LLYSRGNVCGKRFHVIPMNHPRLLEDIRMQPQSLAAVFDYHLSAGCPALRAAARLLRSGKRVLITGMGASMYASIPLEYRLCSAGVDATVVETGELLHYRLESCMGAVVVLVSRSGESVEIAKLLNAVRGRATTIGVTNEPNSTLALGVDHAIHIGSLPDEMVAIQSYTGTVLALWLLGAAAVGDLEQSAGEAQGLIEKLAALIDQGTATLTEWDNFLRSAPPVYLLGRGPSCASAFEGALLFNETAKVPAVGMPVASFRHGPVELVDDRFVCLVFTPSGRTRGLNLALSNDLARFGGKIRVIGPECSGLDGLACFPTPEVSDMLAPLVEIIPVQLAALRLAQLRGLTVGRFRYTPQVTRDESNFSQAN